VALVINDLRRIQISPINFTWLDETSKQAKLIDRKKTIILSYKALDFPGYKKIFKKQWSVEIPDGRWLLVHLRPQQSADENKIQP